MRQKWRILVLFFAVGFSGVDIFGETYYVSEATGNDGNPGTLDLPWKSIDKANSALIAGDTVLVREGTYTVEVGIDPANSGSAGQPIRYANYSGETVVFVGASQSSIAIDLNSDYGTIRSHIIVDGLEFRGFYKQLWILRGSYNEIMNCVFDGSYERDDGQVSWRGSTIYRNAQYNHVHDCVFRNHGNYLNEEDNGVVFELGNENAADDDTAFNLIEDNEFAHGGHHVMGIAGNHNVVRNNYFHNEEWWPLADPDYGNRILFFGGPQPANERNLFENNRVAFGGETVEPNQIGGAGGTLATSKNIIRHNVFHDCLLYALKLSIYPGMVSSDNRIYSNVFYKNGYSDSTKSVMNSEYSHAIYFSVSGDDSSTYQYVSGNAIKNNIFYLNRNSNDPAVPIVRHGQFWGGYELEEQTIENNWLESANPLFRSVPTSILPDSALKADFRLESDSPCIDAGGYLTQIVSPSGTGNRFAVEDASYFMDGWGIVEGDLLQLEGQPGTARVLAVDYATNELTLETAVSWRSSQGIALAYQGESPDIGAYEYQSGVMDMPVGQPTGLRVK